MSKQHRYNTLYMDIACRVAEMSYALRLKVGAVIVKEDRIISMGFNGMPTGWDNDCEYREHFYYGHNFGEFAADYFDLTDEDGKIYRLRTRPEVLHAESNALSKLARSTESGEGADLFVTHAPCIDCAKMIFQAGIKSVYYKNAYRSTDGIDFLKKSGVFVKNFSQE